MSCIRSLLIVSLCVATVVVHVNLRLIAPRSDALLSPCKNDNTMNLPVPRDRIMDLPAEQRQAQNQQQIEQPIRVLQSSTADDIITTATNTLNTNNNNNKGGRNAPNSTALPLPNENGIIIYYMHIPKTGGTTQLAPFALNKDWRYRQVYGSSKQSRYRLEMYDLLEQWEAGSNTRVYYEYHAGTAGPYMDQQNREDVNVWRAMAKVRNIPFFAFTVMREPHSMALSHFNFYYADEKENSRFYWRPEATETDFLELSVPNPQCLFCLKSERAYEKGYRNDKDNSIHVSKEGCDAVYQAFLDDFDWIGTTDKLSSETFPILEHIGQVRYCKGVRNQSFNRIKKSKLSPAAMQEMVKFTSYDLTLYTRAQQDFPVTMWKDLDLTGTIYHPNNPPLLNQRKQCVYSTGQALAPGELPAREGARLRFLDANPDFVPLPEQALKHDLMHRFPALKDEIQKMKAARKEIDADVR